MITQDEALNILGDLEGLVEFWNKAVDLVPQVKDVGMGVADRVALNRIDALLKADLVNRKQALAMAWTIGHGLLPLEQFDNIPAAAERMERIRGND